MIAQYTTIGHSNRSLCVFLDMLSESGTEILVDVRSFPRSRTNPVYNIGNLPGELQKIGIEYVHCAALGGRRSKQTNVDEQVNAFWRVQSFHNYADYALGEEFDLAFKKLTHLGNNRRLTLMCSEAVWWRCHRRIITDYLLLKGHAVDHLMAPGHLEHAVPTIGATRNSLGKVIYSGTP
ncbi:DUF488 family protein [Brucella tritici]|uniref:DUF488 domain-containing protein n=1 Tax=Brucella tritici TaxID=94626 RepID=UPI0015916054|nr:DUF488 domain-containing protein [Brucella tritici]